MQTISQQAQQTIVYQSERLSPYMPALGASIGKTYLVPFGALMVANVAVNIVMIQVPGLFSGILGSAASLVLFIGVLYYGWRWSEGRWHGTSLFVEYTTFSKARRQLQSEIKAQSSDAVIQQYLSEFIELAEGFMETLHNHGLKPLEKTKAKND